MHDERLGRAFLDAVGHRFTADLETIGHCLDQLGDEDLAWRPTPDQNSITNLVLHLCGNVGQWTVAGVGGATDVRDRPAEFASRERLSRAALKDRLRGTIAVALSVLEELDAASLLDTRRIQGFETTVLQAILDTVCHFEGHTQEITSMTRCRRGADYAFRWVPTTPEQGTPPDPSDVAGA